MKKYLFLIFMLLPIVLFGKNYWIEGNAVPYGGSWDLGRVDSAWDTTYTNFVNVSYDYVFTVTPTPRFKNDFTTIKEAVDSANIYATDSTQCLVKIYPGIYHCDTMVHCSSYVFIEGIGKPQIIVDSLLGGSPGFLMFGGGVGTVDYNGIKNLSIHVSSKFPTLGIIVGNQFWHKKFTMENVDIYIDSVTNWLAIYHCDTMECKDVNIFGSGFMSYNVPASQVDYFIIDNFHWFGGDKISADVIYNNDNNGYTYINNAWIYGTDPTDSTYNNRIFLMGNVYLNNVYSKNTSTNLFLSGAGGTLNNCNFVGGKAIDGSEVGTLYLNNCQMDGKLTVTGSSAAINVLHGDGTHLFLNECDLTNRGEGGVLIQGTINDTVIANGCHLYDFGTRNGMIDGRFVSSFYNSTLIQNSQADNNNDMLRIDFIGHQEYINCYIRNYRGAIAVLSRPTTGDQYINFENCEMISDSNRIAWLENWEAPDHNRIDFIAKDCQMRAQTMGNTGGSEPSNILVRGRVDTTTINIDLDNCFLSSIGPIIWRETTDTPCSLWVSNSTFETAESTYSVYSSVGDTKFKIFPGNGNSFNKPMSTVYVAPTDTTEKYGVHRFNSDVAMANNDITGINIASGNTANFATLEISGNGAVTGQLTSCIEEVIKASTGNITAAECQSTLINNYGQGAANTQTLPTATEGLNCQVVTITVGFAFHLDCQGTDKFYLDGVALDDGDKISNTTPAVGDAISVIAVQTGASEWNWIARTLQGTWVDGG